MSRKKSKMEDEAHATSVERGVFYLRVSTRSQEEGKSLEFQRDKCDAIAESVGITMAEEDVIVEVASGADSHRVGLARVKELCERGEVGHVVVYDPTRLARDPFDTMVFIRHCKDHGVRLHFGDGTSVDTVLDELIQYLMGFTGYEERKMTMKRTRDGKKATAKDNKMPNGTGAGLYGTTYNKELKTREIEPVEAAVVRQVFEWRLAGESCGRISRLLNEAGIPSKKGGKWSYGTVGTMLRNLAYTGGQWWGQKRFETEVGKGKKLGNGRKRKRKVTVNPEEDWEWIEGFTPMIIELPFFQAVQQAMERKPRRGVEWNYVLSPFFGCGECRGSVCGATETAGYQKRKHSYNYYRCSGTLKRDGVPKICGLGGMRAEKLEPVVFEHIVEVVKNPEGVLAEFRKESTGGSADLDKRIGKLQGECKKYELELMLLTKQRTKKIINQRVYEKLAAGINNASDQVERELALLVEQKGVVEDWDGLEEGIRVAFLRYADSLDELDDDGMNRLMNLLKVQLTATHGRVLVTGMVDPALFTIGRTSALLRVRSRRCRWV